MTTAREILDGLLPPPDTDGRMGYRLRRVMPDSPLDLFLGREHPSGLPTFLMQIGNADLVPGLETLSTRATAVEAARLPDDPRGRLSVIVKLTETGLIDQYCLVIDHLLRGLDSVPTSRDALRILIARLRAWALFFSTGQGRLSEQRQRGLAGELTVMEELSEAGLDWATAIRSWTGPDRADRDFTVQSTLVEVKTNLSTGRDRIRVSNEFQLSIPHEGRLFVWVTTFAEDQQSGRTLPDRVRRVRDALGFDPASRVAFEESLSRAGYSDVEFEHNHGLAYSIAATRIYLVDENMPRIAASELRAGVDHVSYEVALDACGPCLVPIDVFRHAVAPLAHP